MLQLFVFHASSFTCGHHHFLKKQLLDVEAHGPRIPNFKLKDTKKREPIRIKFDYLGWTDLKLKAKVEKTMENVNDYLKKLLKVNPVAYVDPTSNGPDFPVNTSRQYDIDLYIAVYGKSDLGINIGAMAGSIFGTDDDPRPKVGFLSLNVHSGQIQDNPSTSVKDEKRLMFLVLLHEVFHILGVSPGLYPYFINPETNKRYGPKYPVKDCTLPGKTHKYQIVSFPKIHQYAVERWGVEEFTPGCPAGIEMEDVDIEGTYLSHIEARTFPDEIMTGMGSEIGMITNATLVFLDATGFYDIDYRFAEPYIYGAEETNGMKKIPDFEIGIPALSWPKPYQCEFDDDKQDISFPCHPDLRFVGQCNRMKHHCPGTNDICKDIDFVDPNNTGYYGGNTFRNNILTTSSFYQCTKTSPWSANEIKSGATPGQKAVCILSNLTNDAFVQHPRNPYGICYTIDCVEDHIIVHVGDLTAKCEKEGQEITFPGSKFVNGKLVCPNIKSACAAQKLKRPNYDNLMSDNPQPDVKPEEPDVKPENPDDKPENPDDKPENPDDKPENPDDKPENPDDKPENPDDKPENPDDKPENPDVKPETKEIKPVEPVLSPVAPPPVQPGDELKGNTLKEGNKMVVAIVVPIVVVVVIIAIIGIVLVVMKKKKESTSSEVIGTMAI